MHFADHLLGNVQKKQSPLCLGLDPHWDLIPEHLKKGNLPPKAITTFLCDIIEATAEYVSCVKPQLAFFEVFGSGGMEALREVCVFAKKKELLVIADGKRNDIGSTATAYAEAYLGKDTPYDALTVTPFMGSDGVLPFIEKCEENEKGIFIMVKNSNPSSGEFQDLPVGDELWYEHVARRVSQWGMPHIGKSGFSSVGAVVGATYPDEMKLLRQDMPEQIFLVPGYGTQGGSDEDTAPEFYKGATGAIVNSSRGILFAYRDQSASEKSFMECARKAAQQSSEKLWQIAQKISEEEITN